MDFNSFSHVIVDVHSFSALRFQKYLQGIKVTSSLTGAGYEFCKAFVQEKDIIYSSASSANGWKDAIIGRTAKSTQNDWDFGVAWFDQSRQLNRFTYYSAPYNSDNAIYNVIMTSNIFTFAPTLAPSISPTTFVSTYNPTKLRTIYPAIVPTKNLTTANMSTSNALQPMYIPTTNMATINIYNPSIAPTSTGTAASTISSVNPTAKPTNIPTNIPDLKFCNDNLNEKTNENINQNINQNINDNMECYSWCSTYYINRNYEFIWRCVLSLIALLHLIQNRIYKVQHHKHLLVVYQEFIKGGCGCGRGYDRGTHGTGSHEREYMDPIEKIDLCDII